MDDLLPSSVLWRQAYNALLYSHKKTIVQGYTLWTRGADKLRVTGFDDYFALSDTAEGMEFSPPAHFLMKYDDLVSLEKGLRDTDRPVSLAELALAPDDKEISSELHDADALCFPEGYLDSQDVSVIALAPDRLRKLSLLKPSGYPIDCKVFGGAEPVVAFRYGPSVRGVMAPEDREKLKQLYSQGEIW